MIDGGRVSGLRSQTAWHALAERMRPGDRPVLCLLTPADPYVSIGYHRRLDELDAAACKRRGLSIYRRRAGGGPVLCDDGQLHFQVIAPAGRLPAPMDAAWQTAMGPAVRAFRAMGARATLAAGNDITADGRKISGTGAARIGDAMVFVGNVIFDFDHDAMADVLNVPAEAKPELAWLMRRHLATIEQAAERPVGRDEARDAIVRAYESALGPAREDAFTAEEEQAAAALDEVFADAAWVDQERAAMAPRIKIRAGVSVLLLGPSWITVIHGRVVRAALRDGWVPASGMAPTLERALTGVPMERGELTRAVRSASNGWDRADEFVGAILAAYDGGDR